MSRDTAEHLEMRRRFLATRAGFSVKELEKYAGQWVAWSPDGTRIAAAAANPDLLDAILQEKGEDPTLCVVEGIPDEIPLVGEANGSAE